MQLSTLKLLFLSLFVSLSSAVAVAQTTKKAGNGTKDNPYNVVEITGNEELWMNLLENGQEFYLVERFAGFGANGKTPKEEVQATDFLFAIGDTATVKFEEGAENTNVVPRILPASGQSVLEQLHKLEPNTWLVWRGAFQLLEEVGDYVFNVAEILAVPTSVNRVAVPSFAQQAVYDLSGRLVQTQFQPSALPQGLYIVGGKKVFVR